MESNFGKEEFLSALKSLFGDQQTREESQQFSNKSASENIALQQAAATQAGLTDLRLQQEAARSGAALGQQSYQDRLQSDFNQASKLKNLGASSAGSSASAFGKGAVAPGGYSTNAWGQRGLYNASEVADWNLRQASSIKSIKDASEAEAAGDVKRAMGQSQAQQQLLAAQLRADLAKSGQEQAFQGTQSAAQRASAERIAGTQAQASILGSLFGAVGAGSPNYRYWS